MTFTPAVAGYLWCAVASLFSAGATFMLKQFSGHGGAIDLARLVWLGGAAGSYVLGFFCYGQALSRLEMTTAYPVMTSFTMGIVALAGIVLLGESLSWSKLAGMAMLCAACWLMTR